MTEEDKKKMQAFLTGLGKILTRVEAETLVQTLAKLDFDCMSSFQRDGLLGALQIISKTAISSSEDDQVCEFSL